MSEQRVFPIQKEISRILHEGLPREQRLSPILSPSTRAFYESALTETQRDEYEAGLHSIQRWGAPRKEGFPIDQTFQESNLGHTRGMLELVNEYERDYPKLTQAIDFDTVRLMIVMHDSGEILVGDVPAVGPERESPQGQRRKKLEPVLAKRVLFSQIEDSTLREKAKALYDRVIRKDPTDLEAQLTSFTDKVQSTVRVGPDSIFMGVEPKAEIVDEIVAHIVKRINAIFDPAFNLYRYLPANAVNDMRTIGQKEIMRLVSIFIKDPFWKTDQ